MDKVTRFDRPQLRAFTDDLKAALEEFCKEKGVRIEKTRGTYSNGDTGTLKLEFLVEGGQTREERDFADMAPLYDVDPDALGKDFESNGKRYILKGVNTRAPKYPFIAECLDDGKSYKFGAEGIAARFPYKEGGDEG